MEFRKILFLCCIMSIGVTHGVFGQSTQPASAPNPTATSEHGVFPLTSSGLIASALKPPNGPNQTPGSEQKAAPPATSLATAGSAQPANGPNPAPSSGQATVAPAGGITIAGLPRQLTLKQAMDLLIQRNLAVTAARFDIDAARAAKLIASLRPNPVVTLGAEQMNPTVHPRFLYQSTDNLASNVVYTTRIDQIFERGDKRRLRTEVAEYNLEAAEATLLDVIRQALFNLKQVFYTAVLARENLQVAKENMDYFEETEKLIKLSFEQGAVAEVDLIRIRTQRVQYLKDYTDALKNYQQAVRDLLNLLGVENVPTDVVIVPRDSMRLPSLAAAAPVVLETIGNLRVKPQAFQLPQLRQMALESRPDVINARHLLSAASTSTMLARALRHRDINIGIEHQRIGSEPTVGVVVQFPLFLFNNQKPAIQQAISQMNASRMRLRQVELQAQTDVDKAFSNYQISQQLLKSYSEEFIKQAEEARNIEEFSYRAGHKSLIEFLDAQRAYNQARVAVNQARFDYRINLYQLEQATGKSLLDEDVITERE